MPSFLIPRPRGAASFDADRPVFAGFSRKNTGLLDL